MNETVSKLKRALLATSVAALVAAPAGAEEVLNVTNWAEYIAEDTIANFEKEFGIEVVYDHYDSIEAIDSKLLAGNSGYDVVLHSASSIARLIPAGILKPLDKAKLPNMKHMMPEIMEQLDSKWDPGNSHIVPYMWGTHGVTYNRELVLETYPDAPIGSMDLVLDPVHMKEVAKCGVSFLDSPNDVIPMTLAYLGLSPDSTNRKDYAKVKDTLLAVRPYIKTFDNYAYQRMPQREFCIAVTWGRTVCWRWPARRKPRPGWCSTFYLPPGEGNANLWGRRLGHACRRQERGGGAQVPRLHDASRGRCRGLQLHLVRHGQCTRPRDGRPGSDGQPGVVSPARSGGADVHAGGAAEEGRAPRHPRVDGREGRTVTIRHSRPCRRRSATSAAAGGRPGAGSGAPLNREVHEHGQSGKGA